MMQLKFFIDSETRNSIAINSTQVVYVAEEFRGTEVVGTKIVFPNGNYFIVTDSYLDTVARLND